MAGICSRCDEILGLMLPFYGKEAPALGELHIELPPSQLLVATQCWICRKLSNWLLEENTDLYTQWKHMPLPVTYVSHYNAVAESADVNRRMFSVLAIEPTTGSGVFAVEINLVPVEDCSIRTDLTQKSSKLESIDLDLVKYWISSCMENHWTCTQRGQQWYPTRLVDIGACDQVPRLIVPSEMQLNDCYITLSHRWNDKQEYTKLTSGSMSQLKTAININELPQIFRDAMDLARSLNIHLIWIDSLCVKQDGEPAVDWKIEAQQMDKIYGSALLNLSATLSADGSESLFEQDLRQMSLPFGTNVTIDGASKEYYLLDGDIWVDEIVQAPLNKRGWVLQERCLAQRVLHFGRSQLGWECSEMEALELFPHGLPFTSALSTLSKAEVSRPGLIAAKDWAATEPADIWAKLVCDYSLCSLTFSSDKLIALAGLANRFADACGAQIFAGMWAEESGLLQHLLWTRDEDDRIAFPLESTVNGAPSWSWASTVGRIDITTCSGRLEQVLVKSLQLLQKCDNQLNTPAVDGCLLLHCTRLSLHIRWLEEELTAFEVCDQTFDAVPHLSSVSLDYTDKKTREWNEAGKLFLIPLLQTDKNICSIVVCETEGGNRYSRVGTADISLFSIPGRQRHEHSASRGANGRPDALTPVKLVKNEEAFELLQNISTSKVFHHIKLY